MSSLMGRIDVRSGESFLCNGKVRLADVIARLDGGATLDQVKHALKLEACDVISALAHAALGPGPDDGPPLVQGTPKYRWAAEAISESALAKLLPEAPRSARLALAAGLLQVHDVWDASHEAAQQADDLGERSVSAYWHGIAHRREPDAGNAAYWFRRVGRHQIFKPLWDAAQPLLEANADAGLTARLGSAGTWNPFAMIDLCTTARAGTAAEALARRLQRLEMNSLLGPSTEAVGIT